MDHSPAFLRASLTTTSTLLIAARTLRGGKTIKILHEQSVKGKPGTSRHWCLSGCGSVCVAEFRLTTRSNLWWRHEICLHNLLVRQAPDLAPIRPAPRWSCQRRRTATQKRLDSWIKTAIASERAWTSTTPLKNCHFGPSLRIAAESDVI